MRIYQNGDRCPCCGQELQDKSPEWLELFSMTISILGLEPLPAPELEHVDFQRPPDAGLQPVNPPQPMSKTDTLRKAWEARLDG